MHEPTYGVFCLWPATYGLLYRAGAAKCMPGLLGLSGLLGLPVVSYAYLCGRLPVVSYAYAYALPPRPTWSSMSTWTPKPTYGLLCLPSFLGLPMISYAYLCGLLCLPGLLWSPMPTYKPLSVPIWSPMCLLIRIISNANLYIYSLLCLISLLLCTT